MENRSKYKNTWTGKNLTNHGRATVGQLFFHFCISEKQVEMSI
jgi:hypothetical protein